VKKVNVIQLLLFHTNLNIDIIKIIDYYYVPLLFRLQNNGAIRILDYSTKKWSEQKTLVPDLNWIKNSTVVDSNTVFIINNNTPFWYNVTTQLVTAIPEIMKWLRHDCSITTIIYNNNIYFFVTNSVSHFYCHSTNDDRFYAFRYDCNSSISYMIPRMNTERRDAGIIAYDNEIFVFGGMQGYGTMLSTCECYNIITNSWKLLTTMPHAKCSTHTVILHSSIIAILGGEYYNYNQIKYSYSDEVLLYNVDANTWSVAEWKLPFETESHFSSVYMLTEFQELLITDHFNGTWIFDLFTKKWTRVPN